MFREGYKLYVPLHKSSATGRYEVSGFLLLATECREYVEKRVYECIMFINPTCIRGIRFFKQSLMYSPDDIGQRFILFVDKDFSYIEVV